MCDTTAFVLGGAAATACEEVLLLENVDRVECEGDEIRLTNIFGEQKTLRARLRLIDNTAGRLVLQAL